MKNLITYLKTLWSWVADSQSTDVSLDCRLTVGSPSFHRRSTMLKLVSVLALIFTLGVGNAWATDPVASQTATDGGTYVIAYWNGSAYKALPNVSTTKGTPAGTAITVNASGKVTTVDAPEWKLKVNGSNPAQFYIYYTVSGTNYYLYKNGTTGTSNYDIQAVTSSQHYWTFTAGTGGNAGKYSVHSERGSKNTELYFYNNSKWEVTGTSTVYNIILLEKASYTITATRNNNDYGTVSVTGTTITATPAAGYKVMSGASGYTVVSGTATVTNNGDNTFTVSPSSDCTIRINFESKGCTDHNGDNVISGTETSGMYGPVYPYYEYSTRQILYTRTDLGLAAGKKGTIKSIYFQYANASAMTGTNSVKIYMANTNLSALSTSNYLTSFTEVYSGALNCKDGWNEITLTTPFDYNGIGNLVVVIDDNSNKDEGSSAVFKYHTTSPTTNYAQLYTHAVSTNADPTAAATWTGSTETNNRPNTKFCIQEADMAPATVTLMDNSATLTEVSAGAGVTLPSRAGCSGYTFAGWTKSWTSAQTSWTTTAPTIIPAGSYTPAGDEDLYPVYTKTEGGGSATATIEASNFTNLGSNSYGSGAERTGTVGTISLGGHYITGNSTNIQCQANNANIYNKTAFPGKITRVVLNQTGTVAFSLYVGTEQLMSSSNTSTGQTPSGTKITDVASANTMTWDVTGNYTYFDIKKGGSAGYISSIVVTYSSSTTSYISVPNCCSDPGLAYGTGSVTKTFGDAVFTNTLTNSHGVAVTYSSSDPTVATVNGSGQVTILKAGSTTITASSIAQTVSTVDYCADEASYTLTVNKASISPTLTYSPNSVAAGSSTSAPTVGGNPGSGGVTYAITSATPSGCATINTNTGVVTGVAVGSVTVTATVAATDNYNGNTATATVTITAASNFPNNKTIFIQAGKSGSAWSDNACVVAWFHSYGGSETAQPTYWLFDVTAEGDDKGKKLFAAVVPSSGDLPYLDINRYASNCTTPWNKNGGVSYSDASGSNTIRSEGSGNDQVYWNLSGVTIDLHGDPSGDEWASSLASFSDQGAGVWTATYNNYAPANAAGESQEFKAKTNYNGWIGNTGSNNNATLDGMHVGSTYNITATLDVTDHSLTMSKTFVKGTVHFDLQGHGLAISDLTNVTAGSKISAPSPAPSATGYDFGGWYKEPACTNAWNFGSDVVNETMTLYAKWTKQTYTITSTLNNCSSSPAIPSSYEYTGSAASLSYTITPSSGYRLPTDITVTGTTYTWNSSTGALVLTGTITSNVTITISAVQTHTVDWYVGGSAPANKIGDDGQTTVVDHGGKISAFPATTPDGSACDKTFVGWTNTTSYTHGTSLLFTDVAGSPTINADASFYAVFATGSSGEIFSEDFASFTSGSISSPSSSAESSLDGFDNITYVYQAGEVAKLGTGSYSGSLTTDELTIAAGSSVTISFEVFGWTSVEGDIIVSCDNSGFSDQTVTYTATRDQSMESKSVTVTCTVANPKITIATSTKRAYIDNISISASSYTGHTITCADCGTSVTPTYTASPTGGTVSVTKSASPVTSGSTVKTCTAVDLTVTLTPATHYDLTGFTATGLTTGTATITPAVGSTLPVSVAQTFTVTVSAGATGTLTLAPTFTAQTPLSITLETHSKGTFTPIGDIYSGESFTFPTVTPSDAECSSFLGWIEGTTWSGDGTETDPTAITGLANYHAAGSSSGTLTTTKTYTAVFGEKDTQVIPAYQKVTSAPSNWSGDYLIVRDANSRAFDGSLSTLDAADNYIGVTISEGSITANSTVNASKWTIAKVGATSNYTIKSASGYYIGRTANSNGLNSSTSEEYTNTLAYSTDHVDITSSAGPKLQMNGGTRFRYYGTSQQVLQLYKYNPDAEVVAYTYCTNPACTPRYRVTISSATGGSPEADKTYEHADETITITANPAAGYSFTSWTITKTTGGDNVTSTLLTGDKPTTANTTFTMPAYDITIAATYTKKMVSTLEVKDGATIVSTTTGPVSGTVNISTGANKTLDVVITPSDAYDHSWTATVSAGSTYASISNVTDDGFRVNGLAQGDATVTVTAPNDGNAKVVTFTVHVTDVLPEEIILKRDGSVAEIETLTMYYDAANSRGQYVKVNVSYSPTPTNKNFAFSSAATGKVGSHSHSNVNLYEVLVANGVTSSPVNCTFTSEADGSVTKVLAVTVLPLLTDRFVDYIQGNATQTVSARLSADRYDIITDINTPSISDASDANPTSEDCKTAHYHMIGWLPQATAEALWAAGTAITEDTEGLVSAGATVEATGQTWYAIWAKEE